MDPALLVREMRPSTLGMWLALHHLDPWDESRADLRAAVMTAGVYNAFGTKKIDGTRFGISDFLLYDDIDAPPEPEEDDEALAARFRIAFGCPDIVTVAR